MFEIVDVENPQIYIFASKVNFFFDQNHDFVSGSVDSHVSSKHDFPAPRSGEKRVSIDVDFDHVDETLISMPKGRQSRKSLGNLGQLSIASLGNFGRTSRRSMGNLLPGFLSGAGGGGGGGGGHRDSALSTISSVASNGFETVPG